MTERIALVIEDLLGSCLSLEEVCEELGFESFNLTQEELERLDSEGFMCESCGWWCWSSERNCLEYESYCDDCYDSLI